MAKMMALRVPLVNLWLRRPPLVRLVNLIAAQHDEHEGPTNRQKENDYIHQVRQFYNSRLRLFKCLKFTINMP